MIVTDCFGDWASVRSTPRIHSFIPPAQNTAAYNDTKDNLPSEKLEQHKRSKGPSEIKRGA
jgi:hypothetical protein